MACVFLVVLLRSDLRFMGTFVMRLVIIMLVAASMGFSTPVGHLVPALQSYWLIIHVSIAVMASALFTLTFAMSVLQLVQDAPPEDPRRRRARQAGVHAPGPQRLSLENLPTASTPSPSSVDLHVMFGAIWAEKAWGRFWGWDTKEVWTFVIWVVYAGYLHARATRGWTGTRAAWLSSSATCAWSSTSPIVNQFFNGLHSYSGV